MRVRRAISGGAVARDSGGPRQPGDVQRMWRLCVGVPHRGDGGDATKTSFEESCRYFREIYDNTQVDANFEEAGRLTDSAVADSNADDVDEDD